MEKYKTIHENKVMINPPAEVKNELFDLGKIKAQIKEFEENPIGYRIGVFYSEKESSYCLVRYHKHDNSVNIILLCKTIFGISNQNSFKEEVQNLAKYFNAEIIEENN